MISLESCGTEDWSDDAEYSAYMLITCSNFTIEKSYFKIVILFHKIIVLFYTLNAFVVSMRDLYLPNQYDFLSSEVHKDILKKLTKISCYQL